MKDNKKIILETFVTVLMIFSNVIAANVITIFGSSIACSILIYPFIFLLILLITEFYGKKEASKCVYVSLGIQAIIFLLSIIICNLPTSSESLEIITALRMILTPSVTNGFYYPTINLMLGAFASFGIALLVNINLYSYLKEKSNKLISSFGAILLSLIIDSVIFILFTSFGTTAETSLASALVTQIICRCVISIILTAIFYISTRNYKN